MTSAEQTHFFKRLAFLLNAHVPLLESLYILHEQSNTKHKRLLKKIARDVSEGQSLSNSFAKHPRYFGMFSVSMLAVGESSGSLSNNLVYLSEQLQKRQQLKRTIIGASIYPLVIAFFTLCIVAFLMLYLFPKIVPLFLSLHTTLPVTTRVVIAASYFLESYWLILLTVSIAAAVSLVILVRKVERVHLFFDRTLLRLPLIGAIVRAYTLANISRTLGILLKSGVLFSEALTLTAETSTNRAYRKVLYKLIAAVERGEKVSLPMTKQSRYFPPLYCQMLAVGERSGTLADTGLYLAELYASEVDEYAKNLSSLIEPLLMVGMGLLVGFIALSIITPIYGITQSLRA